MKSKILKQSKNYSKRYVIYDNIKLRIILKSGENMATDIVA